MNESTGAGSLSAQHTSSGELLESYRTVRRQTEQLCAPLAVEDYVVQPMPDASPAKWHLAHTSWFFETFVLKSNLSDYRDVHPAYAFLFNSYYVQAGARHDRNQRGLITRPTVAETHAYRAHVDTEMERLLVQAGSGVTGELAALVTLGLNHEQQHQELIVTDVKYLLAQNPLRPAYRNEPALGASIATLLRWQNFSGGIAEIGARAGMPFSFDNEGPRHQTLLRDFELASRTVTNAEYLAFIEDGGYRRAELWLSDGFAVATEQGWQAPLYWEQQGSGWSVFTLSGMQALAPHAPACHLSYYEAEAYARWAGCRLPSEFEWEHAANTLHVTGNFVESGALCPLGATKATNAVGLSQLFGDLWEWTQSPYAPYPGYRPAEGALGEYNGKFMANQYVLRGGSCATSQNHIRPSYRNFFHPDKRWQFSGIRLARDS